MSKKIVSYIVSGRGSNFTAVAEQISKGNISAKNGILISNRSDAKALEIAREFGMKAFCLDHKLYSSRKDHEKEMVKLLNKYKTDLVVAAGYMRILSPYFIKKFKNKIINIHPALLPSFPGVDAQKQAFDYGVKITGCTTHFVDEGTDTGPIIMQSIVSVEKIDTLKSLSQKILKEEHKTLPESVKLFCENRIRVSGRFVIKD